MPPRARTVARGYGAAHKRERERWAPLVAAGRAICVRCDQPIEAGSTFDLDHNEERNGWNGPSHVYCNRSAGAKNRNAMYRRSGVPMTIREWGESWTELRWPDGRIERIEG